MEEIPRSLAPASIREPKVIREALGRGVSRQVERASSSEEKTVLEGLHTALIRSELDFPPLPQPAIRMLELWGNIEKVRHSTIIGIVEADPALAGRIVQTANSPFFMVTTPARSLRSAIVRIGLVEVRRVIMAEAFGKTFKAPGFEDELEAIRRHCQVVGWLGASLASDLEVAADDAFLAGLMHDAGELAVFHMVQSCARAGLWVRDEGLLVVGEGRETLVTMARQLHLALGALFMDHWNLSADIGSAMAYHHHPDRAEESFRPLCRTVQAADHLSELALAHFKDVAWLEWLAEHDVDDPAASPDDGVDDLPLAPIAQQMDIPLPTVRRAVRSTLLRISENR